MTRKPKSGTRQSLISQKWLLLVLIVFGLSVQAWSQDLDYARKVHKKLTSKAFHGRGYVKNGDGMAAAFIAKQFSADGLQAFDDSYFQYYSFPINTFVFFCQFCSFSIFIIKFFKSLNYLKNRYMWGIAFSIDKQAIPLIWQFFNKTI
jgi:hypothetical protein